MRDDFEDDFDPSEDFDEDLYDDEEKWGDLDDDEFVYDKDDYTFDDEY